MLEIKVSIDLGRCDIRVAEEFLNTPEIVARFKQVRGE
jgi:hypothetical protein